MSEELLSGDTGQVADAGQQTQVTDLTQGTEPNTGVTEPADAGQEGSEDTLTPEQELAFKKRLEREQAKMEERLRAEYEEKYAPIRQQTPEQAQNAVRQVADELGITDEAARVLINQQLAVNQMKDNLTKSETKAEIAALRASKPWLPEWDDGKLQKIRADYQREHGFSLPWKAAYQQLVADAAINGLITQAVEQRTLQNVTGRNAATLQAGKGRAANPPDYWSMPQEEFEKLKDRVRAGETLK